MQLRFPWGPVRLTSQTLTIGRDFGAECGGEIEEFDNVSRRHAVIRIVDGAVLVEDQASTNGTTVNGEPTVAYAARRVREGDVLGFGAHLRVVVEVSKDGP